MFLAPSLKKRKEACFTTYSDDSDEDFFIEIEGREKTAVVMEEEEDQSRVVNYGGGTPPLPQKIKLIF